MVAQTIPPNIPTFLQGRYKQFLYELSRNHVKNAQLELTPVLDYFIEKDIELPKEVEIHYGVLLATEKILKPTTK